MGRPVTGRALLAAVVLAALSLLIVVLAVAWAMPAHAGRPRLVPLCTCTSQPYTRTGEVVGCEGWVECAEPTSWGYGQRGADGSLTFVRASP